MVHPVSMKCSSLFGLILLVLAAPAWHDSYPHFSCLLAPLCIESDISVLFYPFPFLNSLLSGLLIFHLLPCCPFSCAYCGFQLDLPVYPSHFIQFQEFEGRKDIIWGNKFVQELEMHEKWMSFLDRLWDLHERYTRGHLMAYWSRHWKKIFTIISDGEISGEHLVKYMVV